MKITNQIILVLLFQFSIFTSNKLFAQTPGVIISVDVKLKNIPISPFIYGRNNTLSNNPSKPLTSADWIRIKESGVRILREGHGNNSTKYNWKRKLGSSPDWFNNIYAEDWDYAAKELQKNCPDMHGMWSFQLIGKAAKSLSYNYDVWGLYIKTGKKAWPPISSHQNLTGNGEPDMTPDSRHAAKEGDTNLYLTDWPADSTVAILDHWYGSNGLNLKKEKIQYWCMDNEPEIWSGTHDDVQPALTADQFITNYIKTAKLARAKYPDIKLVGPSACNEWFWWFSWGSHSPKIWLEYFIKRIADEEKASGIKLLDVLDIHYYPGTSDSTKLLQMHRVYFDKTYSFPEASGSAMADGGWDTSIKNEYILERCRTWLSKYFGANNKIGLGVTECGINTKNPNIQALFYASTMGEFMKNGGELFTPWSWSPGMWEALHLFARYNKSICVLSSSNQETNVSAYTSINSTSDSLVVMLLNKTATEKVTRVNLPNFKLTGDSITTLTLKNLPAVETFKSHTDNALVKSTFARSTSYIDVTLAPFSITSVLANGNVISTIPPVNNDKTIVFKVYQSPVTNKLNLEFNEFKYNKIEIFDVNGRMLISKNITYLQKNVLDINLTKGVFCIKISNDQRSVSKKFTVQ